MINVFENLFPTNLYHSYVIEGDPNITGEELLRFLEVRGEVESQSPDVLYQTYESFTINDSHEIKSWHSRQGVTKGKKVCIIATKFINREAEQTLLKIIEEPTTNTHFFIIVPDSSLLLDTIISRTHLIKIEQDTNIDIKKIVILFIKSTTQDRIKSVAEIIEKNKDKDNSGQLRYYATSFVNELESVFYKKFKINKTDKQVKFVLEELQKSRGYLSTPGASVKMILEHLALVI